LILAALGSFVSIVPVLASPLWSLREIPAEGTLAGSTTEEAGLP
jgi:hypothetical protein